MSRNILLAMECALLFVGLPLLLATIGAARMGWLFVLLWVLAGLCLAVMAHAGRSRRMELWKFAALRGPRVRAIVLTFTVCALLITLFTALVYPEKLFSFPRENPLVWVLVMLLYPMLSVLPQEIIYRSFFFYRYRALFRNERELVVANAVLFAFCHIIFHNILAVAFTFAGGLLFARTYARTGSLALVTAEHALYGCFIFTIGLGRYFYHAAGN